ncbi:Oidioi.mRNA.OKI2018_I69.chr1.g689.t1.cds [Oikopleura dioica]|uniref:Cytidine deaminase n=1 Tax=Oikopleura dioica TaxID=34765 RepID=A0ABN7SKN0_OIKDI|nr:Oidioi.mRNA.OKI2018_I69.chr1.g689.t1.cds [Oikopleura dioica]
MDKESILHLLQRAREVRENAYAPYSKFRVGAALLTTDGKIFTGCNVENLAYGSATCAERTGICKAVSEGSRTFSACLITSDLEDWIYPCGNCRQTLAEFGDMTLILTKNEGDETKIMKLSDIHGGCFATMNELLNKE